MRKYKQFIFGFLVGAMLFSIAPVSAAIEEYLCYKADYKVMINGSEYISEDLPILNYKGNTYAPFRSILEKAGLNVAWNAELGQAEVTSNPTSAQINDVEGTAMNTITKTEYDPATGLPVGSEYVDNSKDGKEYKTVKYNDEIYISTTDLEKLFGISSKYVDGFGTCFFKSGLQLSIDSKDKSNRLYANSRLYFKIALFEDQMGE